MTFLVAIHKDPDSSFGVSIHLTGMLDDGLDLPEPSTNLDQLSGDPDYVDAIWGAVSVELNWKRPSSTAA